MRSQIPRSLVFLVALVTGTASYHLYFLLVSMQLYLVFPLLRRLLRATAGRHREPPLRPQARTRIVQPRPTTASAIVEADLQVCLKVKNPSTLEV